MRQAIITVLIVTVILLIGCKRQPADEAEGPTGEPTTAPAGTPGGLGLTVKQLENTPDDQLEELIFNATLRGLEGRFDWEDVVLQKWTPGLRMLYATFELEGEVNNGGFNQYFWNTNGKCVLFALEGFRLIGADKYAALVDRAIRIRAEEAPKMQKYKDTGTTEAFSASYEETKLNDLDDEFFALDGKLLSKLRVKYIRDHPLEFAVQ